METKLIRKCFDLILLSLLLLLLLILETKVTETTTITKTTSFICMTIDYTVLQKRTTNEKEKHTRENN